MGSKTSLAKRVDSGLVALANSIINDKPNHINFAEHIDSELEQIPTPDINDKVRCSQCLSYDKWENRDADYEGEDKYFRYVCMGHMSPDLATFGNQRGDSEAFCFCENEITIYLDEKNEPIFPAVKR